MQNDICKGGLTRELSDTAEGKAEYEKEEREEENWGRKRRESKLLKRKKQPSKTVAKRNMRRKRRAGESNRRSLAEEKWATLVGRDMGRYRLRCDGRWKERIQR